MLRCAVINVVSSQSWLRLSLSERTRKGKWSLGSEYEAVWGWSVEGKNARKRGKMSLPRAHFSLWLKLSGADVNSQVKESQQQARERERERERERNSFSGNRVERWLHIVTILSLLGCIKRCEIVQDGSNELRECDIPRVQSVRKIVSSFQKSCCCYLSVGFLSGGFPNLLGASPERLLMLLFWLHWTCPWISGISFRDLLPTRRALRKWTWMLEKSGRAELVLLGKVSLIRYAQWTAKWLLYLFQSERDFSPIAQMSCDRHQRGGIDSSSLKIVTTAFSRIAVRN